MGAFDFTYSFNSTGVPEMDEIIRQQLNHQRAYDNRKGGGNVGGAKNAPIGNLVAADGFATSAGVGNFSQGEPMFAHPTQSDFMRAMGPSAQANTLQGMADQTMGAIQRENDSRVAQEREIRRQEHEKNMLATAQNSAKDQEIARLRQLIAELRAELNNNRNGVIRLA